MRRLRRRVTYSVRYETRPPFYFSERCSAVDLVSYSKRSLSARLLRLASRNVAELHPAELVRCGLLKPRVCWISRGETRRSFSLRRLERTHFFLGQARPRLDFGDSCCIRSSLTASQTRNVMCFSKLRLRLNSIQYVDWNFQLGDFPLARAPDPR